MQPFFKRDKTDYSGIARQIIKNTGLDENLGILRQKKHVHPSKPRETLKLILSLSTVNLAQTLKSDFIVQEVPEEVREGILKEYVHESLRQQELMRLAGAEIAALYPEVMAVVAELQNFWSESEDPQGSGPGPRYFCVKEVLRRLGGDVNYDLRDALFELMYLQYRHYHKFFQSHLSQPDPKGPGP
ncbi:MAG TPA: hypothetical protein VHE12_03265 [bacterium]|nr:hypothetical protein [bacterium]